MASEGKTAQTLVILAGTSIPKCLISYDFCLVIKVEHHRSSAWFLMTHEYMIDMKTTRYYK
jgi:hypothetical protein